MEKLYTRKIYSIANKERAEMTTKDKMQSINPSGVCMNTLHASNRKTQMSVSFPWHLNLTLRSKQNVLRKMEPQA